MQQQLLPRGWAGIDVGKGHHWVCLIDEAGTTVWSAKVVNDEAAILEAVGAVLARAEQVLWAVDVTGTMSGLLLALLAAHGQQVKYVPGRIANQMSTAYRGEAKTDARDAYVIAETVRHRGDLAGVEVSTALVSELRLLVAHRTDLVGDRVRMINRLRDVLSGYFPALECLRFRPQPRRPGPADRLPDPGRSSRQRSLAAAGVVGQAEGPQRRAGRGHRSGGGQDTAHSRARPGCGRFYRGRPRRFNTGHRRTDQ